MNHPASLLLVGYEGIKPPAELLERISAGRVGGVILFGRNIGTIDDVAAAIDVMGKAAPPGPPLIIAIDQEGGRVQRIKEPFTRWPPMWNVGERDDVALSEAVGRSLGEELRLLGFNVNFAPVLDVRTNPQNQVIGDRAFAGEPDGVARHGLAFWRGLESSGVRGCAKHFPGHGDTREDSHLELPTLSGTRARFDAVELAPFRAAVEAGVTMVMTAHIVYPAIDAKPATMSAAWIDGVLRGQLGYRGVVVSDDFDMQAVAARFSVDEAVRSAVAAGVDLLLACRDPERQRAIETTLVAAAGDPVLAPRIEAALARALTLRAALAPAAPAPPDVLAGALPDENHRRLAASITNG